MVYEQVLSSLPFSSPTYFGAYEDIIEGELWVILEYLDDTESAEKSLDFSAVQNAAIWVGKFHSYISQVLQSERFSFLKRYDAAYYYGWLNRTREYSNDLLPRYPLVPSDL